MNLHTPSFLRRRPEHMAGAVIAYVLNLTDLGFTLYAINHGAVELNPFMRSVPIMVFYKILVVGPLCWFVSRQSKTGIGIITAVYAAVNVWHILNIF